MYVGMLAKDVMAMLNEKGVEYDYIGRDEEGAIYVGGYWEDGLVLEIANYIVVDEYEDEWGDEL